jgi:phosphatidylglycerophosphate synthase
MYPIKPGRKLPSELENPVDVLFLDIFDGIKPCLHDLGVTPNHLTLLSAVFGVAAIYAISCNHFVLSSILYAFSYYLDCVDGNYARTYDMTSQFGDWFDHVKDIVVFIGLVVVIAKNTVISIRSKICLSVLVVCLSILTYVAYGCQEKFFNKPTATTASSIQYCRGDASTLLRRLRFFNSTTLVITICCFLLSIPCMGSEWE